VRITRAWETIRVNIRISAKHSLNRGIINRGLAKDDR
jgi:hypothetical protein